MGYKMNGNGIRCLSPIAFTAIMMSAVPALATDRQSPGPSTVLVNPSKTADIATGAIPAKAMLNNRAGRIAAYAEADGRAAAIASDYEAAVAIFSALQPVSEFDVDAARAEFRSANLALAGNPADVELQKAVLRARAVLDRRKRARHDHAAANRILADLQARAEAAEADAWRALQAVADKPIDGNIRNAVDDLFARHPDPAVAESDRTVHDSTTASAIDATDAPNRSD